MSKTTNSDENDKNKKNDKIINEFFEFSEFDYQVKKIFDPNYPVNYEKIVQFFDPQNQQNNISSRAKLKFEILKATDFENGELNKSEPVIHLKTIDIKDDIKHHNYLNLVDPETGAGSKLNLKNIIPAGFDKQFCFSIKITTISKRYSESVPLSYFDYEPKDYRRSSYARTALSDTVGISINMNEKHKLVEMPSYEWLDFNDVGGFNIEMQIKLMNLKTNKVIREKKLKQINYEEYLFAKLHLKNIYRYGFPVVLGKHYLSYMGSDGITLLDRDNFDNVYFQKFKNHSYRKILYLNKKGNFLISGSCYPPMFILKLKEDKTFKITPINEIENNGNYAITVDEKGKYIFFVDSPRFFPHGDKKLKIYDLEQKEIILELSLEKQIINLAYDDSQKILLLLDENYQIHALQLNSSHPGSGVIGE